METQEEAYNENVLNGILDDELEKIRIDLGINETDFVKYLKGFVEFKEKQI